MIERTPLYEGVPGWCAKYLTTSQFENMLPRTCWAVLLDSAPLPPVAHHVALRLHLYAIGSDDDTAFPSIEKLMKVTGRSRITVRGALRDLEAAGWIQSQGRMYPSGKRAATLYTLTFPVVDVMTPASASLARCGAPRKGGEPCAKKAGWGTSHPGSGKCKLHDDPPVEGRQWPVGGQPLTPSGGQPLTS